MAPRIYQAMYYNTILSCVALQIQMYSFSLKWVQLCVSSVYILPIWTIIKFGWKLLIWTCSTKFHWNWSVALEMKHVDRQTWPPHYLHFVRRTQILCHMWVILWYTECLVTFVNTSGSYSWGHSSQRCHTNIGLILNSYRAMDRNSRWFEQTLNTITVVLSA
jgi:hypothetical protein